SKCVESRGRDMWFCCFFFQAEDGIRDWSVTGVQTCALPIWSPPGSAGNARPPFRPPSLEKWLRRDTAMTVRTAWKGGACGPVYQIGRASCRERGESSGGGGA